MTKRFNSPLYSNMVIDMEHKIPSILCVNEEQKNEFLNGLNALHEENEQLKSDLGYYRETYSIQEYGLDIETHVQLSSPILSRKELLKENEQLYELINFANTLIAFKTSESCQKEWEKRLKELKE